MQVFLNINLQFKADTKHTLGLKISAHLLERDYI